MEEINTQSLNNDLLAELEQFFAPKCSFCSRAMEISEGDVIYDTKWYHKSCWEYVEKEQTQKPSNPDESNFISIANYA